MKKILTLLVLAIFCTFFVFGVNVCAEVHGEEVIVANLSGGNRLTFNYDTDKGKVLLQCLSVPENFSGSKYYKIGSALTETSEASADVVLTGGGDGEFVLKYAGKQENEVNTIIKIGENIKITTTEGDITYSSVKLSLVYGGVKTVSSNEGTVSVWIESDNATILQSGADNVTILGASSLIDLTNEKDSADTSSGAAVSETKTDKPFPAILVVVLIALVLAGAVSVMYFTLPTFKEKVDKLLKLNGKHTKRR